MPNQRACTEGWQDETLADLIKSARRVVADTDVCACPDEPHQNALHDLAHDLARIAPRSLRALTYIARPTMGLPVGIDPGEFVREQATDRAVRLALETCIRVASDACKPTPKADR